MPKPDTAVYDPNPTRVDRGIAHRDLAATLSDDPHADDTSRLVDILADLRHWAADTGINFATCANIAEQSFEEEAAEPDRCRSCGRTTPTASCAECGGK